MENKTGRKEERKKKGRNIESRKAGKTDGQTDRRKEENEETDRQTVGSNEISCGGHISGIRWRAVVDAPSEFHPPLVRAPCSRVRATSHALIFWVEDDLESTRPRLTFVHLARVKPGWA